TDVSQFRTSAKPPVLDCRRTETISRQCFTHSRKTLISLHGIQETIGHLAARLAQVNGEASPVPSRRDFRGPSPIFRARRLACANWVPLRFTRSGLHFPSDYLGFRPPSSEKRYSRFA